MPKSPKLSGILSFSAVLLFAVVAHSQGTVITPAQVGEGIGNGEGSGNGSGAGIVTGFIGGLGPSTEKGRPFSADVIDEDDRYLADGNHIHRENHGKVFRDSEGRSRNEVAMGGMAGSTPWFHITILDPMQNVFILLDPQNKIANVRHFGVPSRPADFKAAPRATQPAPAARSGTATPATVAQTRSESSPEVEGPRPSRRFSREDLGTMEIEGFVVRGTRITTTIPAGEMGNDKPMTSTTERWVSEDLKMELLTKSSSPESGQHTHRVVNIRSGEPDPLLFQPPADYTVKELSQQ